MTSTYQPTGPDGIITAGGTWIRPLDPDPALIDIKDIAHSLANQCRFTGHTSRFYSTAQHSVLVSRTVQRLLNKEHGCEIRMLALWGLLHDASEAYLSDIARPLKLQNGFGERYREVETGLLQAVSERFGLDWPMPDIVKRADNMLLWAEMRDLMPNDPPEGKRAYGGKITPWSPTEARANFLWRYEELRPDRERDWDDYFHGRG